MSEIASDASLWSAWVGGDKAAGRELFERYFKAISRFFATKVQHDQDDLIQETFAACLAGRERLRDPQRFRSYLFGVAYNVLRTHYRRRYGLRESEEELGSRSVHDLAPGPSTLLRGDEQQRLLAEALRRLPLDHQVVVELSYWEGMRSSEIGLALGIPAATARTRLRRARTLLAQQLEQLPASLELRGRALEGLDEWARSLREAAGTSD